MKQYTEQTIIRARQVILNGGVVLAPTDTSYAIFANAFDLEAVNKIYAIKGRMPDVPLPIMLAQAQDSNKYAILSEQDNQLINRILPGLISVVVRKKPGIIGDFLTAGKPSVSLMLHRHEVAWKLAWYAGVPLAVSSANVHKQGSLFSYDDAQEAVGQCVDLSIDGGKLPLDKNNTVLDLTAEQPTVLREGAYKFEDLQQYFPNIKLVCK